MRWILLLIACATPPAARVETSPVAGGQLPFIEDDYARARDQARANKLPLFVEAWAPW